MEIITEINLTDFANTVPDAQALQLVVLVDEAQSDWYFTQECAKYFVDQIIAGCKGDKMLNVFYEELKDMLK